MRLKPAFKIVALILALSSLGACAPQLVLPGPSITEPKITATSLIMADGAALPLHRWQPEDKSPKAILLALHGFNDYGLFV